MALSDRLSGLPIRGTIGMQNRNINQRFAADLPAQVQLNAINQILAGQDIPNPYVNNFVRQSASKGMTPEQIRQAFIAEQRASKNPLIVQ